MTLTLGVHHLKSNIVKQDEKLFGIQFWYF